MNTLFKFEECHIRRFLKNEILCDSVCFRFVQISENADKWENIKTIDSSIPIHQITGLRNKIVHEYTGINFYTIYKTIKEDLSA